MPQAKGYAIFTCLEAAGKVGDHVFEGITIA